MKILAFDPGKLTGYVVFNSETRELVEGGQIAYEDAPSKISSLINATVDGDVVAYERYIISPQTVRFSRQHEALDVIGGIIFLVSLLEAKVILKPQTASVAKTKISNGILKELGYFKQCVGVHQKDAMRHCLLALDSVS